MGIDGSALTFLWKRVNYMSDNSFVEQSRKIEKETDK